MTEEQLRAQLDAIYASTSWKVTAPLRWLSQIFQKINGIFTVPSKLFNLFRRMPRAILGKIVSQPLLRQMGLKVLIYFPRLKMRLKKTMMDGGGRVAKHRPDLSIAPNLSEIKNKNLTADAQKILCELQHLIQNQKS